MSTEVFLFTDIEASTRRWIDAPAAMRVALEQHDRLLAEAVRRHRGTVFKHTGDGAAVLLPTARDAVLAAADIQRAMAESEWDGLEPLRLRIAIHAGEASSREGDWFGPALNHAARLMGVGHGGQVLLSEAAAAIVREESMAGYELIDLGQHSLRDFSYPEHIWQLVGDGLESVFPPLRALDAVRGNLPGQLSSFVGRAGEVEELVGEILVHRLTTLVGPGGVGKTRLALQAAAAVVDKFPDGAWLIELAPLSDPSAIDHTLMNTLRLKPRGGYTARQTVIEAVRDWRCLLVVDNCEHLLEPVRGLVSELLRDTSEAVVVATSREGLGADGEHIWAVAPLPPRSAGVELFAERAAESNRTFRIAESDIEVVANICEHLDGMPLSIELAAARCRSLTPREIAERLNRRFVLLSDRRGNHAGRHASLQATLDWSFDLLDDELKEFFCRLSVFAGSFDLPAAHLVCGDSIDDLETLAHVEALIDKSLVRRTDFRGGTRYGLLETMRQFGAERLEASEFQSLRQRHADHFAAVAEHTWEAGRNHEELEWCFRIAEDKDNLRAAFDFAVEREDARLALRIAGPLYLYTRARLDGEMWQWVETASNLPGASDQALAVRNLVHASIAGNMLGDPAAAEKKAGQAAELEARLGLEPDPAVVLAMCYSAGFGGKVSVAEGAARRGIQLALDRGDRYRYEEAEGLYLLGFQMLSRGQQPEEEHVRRCLERSEQVGSARCIANAYWLEGVTYADVDAQRALTALEAGAAIARAADNRFLIGLLPGYAAMVRANLDPVVGLRAFVDSFQYLRASGNRLGIRVLLRNMLPAFAEIGRHDLVARFDGATLPFSIRVHRNSEVLQQATRALGEDVFEHLRQQGRGMTDDEIVDLVCTEVDVIAASRVAPSRDKSIPEVRRQ